MLPTILKVDCDESGTWIIQLRREDGQTCQAKFTHEAFKTVRACPMGQFLLHTWFGRASVVPEVRTNA